MSRNYSGMSEEEYWGTLEGHNPHFVDDDADEADFDDDEADDDEDFDDDADY